MKYLKTYESYGGETIYDIREFFANLKKLSYYFEDYYKFINLFDEITKKLDLKYSMPFFGFTNDTESQFNPIINTVTKELHEIFPMIVKGKYNEIYNFFTNKEYGDFELKTRRGTIISLESSMSKRLAQDINFLPKPYFETKFSNKNGLWNDNRDYENDNKKIKEIVNNSDLINKYNIKVYNNGKNNEVRIISKNKKSLKSEQLKEVQKAREFGVEKYNFLKPLVGVTEDTWKYNL